MTKQNKAILLYALIILVVGVLTYFVIVEFQKYAIIQDFREQMTRERTHPDRIKARLKVMQQFTLKELKTLKQYTELHQTDPNSPAYFALLKEANLIFLKYL